MLAIIEFQVPGEGGMKLHIEKEHSVIQLVTQPETTNTVSGLEQSLPLPAPLEVEITNNSTANYKKIKRKWPQEKNHQCNLCPYETNRAERLRVHILGKVDDRNRDLISRLHNLWW